MAQLNLSNYLELIKAVVYSLGGPAFIILGLSTLLGKYISRSKLESLKSKHKKDLEQTKAELERTKSQFFRYSEKQFDLYNSLWKVLIRTRILADSLWEDATLMKLPGFSEQIKQTRWAVMDNMLLIEESHYDNLDKLLKEFEEFKFGKQRLIDIRMDSNNKPLVDATIEQVKLAVKKNKNVRKKYTKLIMDIGYSFRKQIKG